MKQQHLERRSKNMCGLRVKNVCLSERKKKSAELWDSVSIYRGQKTLKNRYGWLWFKSGRILLRKIEKGMHNRHPKVVRPKSTSGKFGPFRVPFGTQKCRIGPMAPNALSCSGAVWTPLLGFFGHSLYLDAFSSSAYDFSSLFWIIQNI